MVLETEFGYREMDEAVVIDFQPPLRQKVERRHGPGPTALAIFPHALPQLLAMYDSGQQRENRLHQHPSIPGPALTYFHVHWLSGLRMKPRVRQDNHGVDNRGDQGVTIHVMDVRCPAAPGPDQPPLSQDKTALAAHDPPMITCPFLADLVQAASFPHRMDELHPIAVGDSQHRGRSQTRGRPCRVGLGPRKHARSLW